MGSAAATLQNKLPEGKKEKKGGGKGGEKILCGIRVLQIAGITIQLDPIAKINEAAFFTFPYCCNYYIAVDIRYVAENYTRLRNRGNYVTTCRTLKGRHLFLLLLQTN